MSLISTKVKSWACKTQRHYGFVAETQPKYHTYTQVMYPRACGLLLAPGHTFPSSHLYGASLCWLLCLTRADLVPQASGKQASSRSIAPSLKWKSQGDFLKL
jgi:hypothetical protein